MPDLRACYFCGEVGDGLARRTVLPTTATDGDRVTAVLCPRCDRKLSRIVDPLVDSADGIEGGETDAESAGIAPAGSETGGDRSSEAESGDNRPAETEEAGPSEAGRDESQSTESEPIEFESAESERDGAVRDETEPTDAATGPGSTDSERGDANSAELRDAESGTSDRKPGASDRKPDTAGAQTNAEPAARGDPTEIYETIEDEIIVAGETGGDAGDGGRGGDADDGVTFEHGAASPEADDGGVSLGDRGNGELTGDRAGGADADRSAADVEADRPEGSRPEADRTGIDRSEADAEDGSDGVSTWADVGDDAPSDPGEAESNDDPMEAVTVNPMAFRRVMRLLSNREFPVDRAEFESLASSAYDLDEGDVSAMLDAAVDRNLIGERDGRLVRE